MSSLNSNYLQSLKKKVDKLENALLPEERLPKTFHEFIEIEYEIKQKGEDAFPPGYVQKVKQAWKEFMENPKRIS